MLIRVRGGREGIREYLESGRKQGQVAHRDALDQRLPLHGDLDLLDACIKAKKGSAEKYLHVTLAFKEDSLEESVYQEIVDRFERFIFPAYKAGEYNYYAEAHLPRIKSYLDKSNGRVIERKPHIHIIIPKVNLFSGTALNPLGMLYKSCAYTDAFQESINLEFGLASPKESRRGRLESQESILARRTGAPYAQRGLSVKESILCSIMQRNINTISELEHELEKYGLVKKRQQELGGWYFNLKPFGWDKGVNLKDYVFSPDFLKLSIQEKRKHIEDADPSYIERIYDTAGTTSQKHEALMQEWLSRVAFELKYLNSGNKAVYKRYQGLPSDEKIQFLERRASAFYKRYELPLPQTVLHDSALPSPEEDMKKKRLATTLGAEKVQPSNPLIFGLARIQEEALAVQYDSSLIAAIKKQVHPAMVLSYAVEAYKVRPEKYSIVTLPDTSARIVSGSRKLNVSDFLTKELHLPWPEAFDVLIGLYEKALADRARTEMPNHKSVHHLPCTNAHEKEKPLSEERSLQEQLKALRSAFQDAKRSLYKKALLSRVDRKAQVSILQTNYLQAIEVLLARQVPSKDISPLSRANEQKDYRQATLDTATTPTGAFSLLPKVGAAGQSVLKLESLSFVPLFSGLCHIIKIDGSVEYKKNGQSVLRDTGRRVIALEHTDETLIMCLRLAIMKFGLKVTVYGSDEFKEKLVHAAVKARLPIEFTDPIWEKKHHQVKARALKQKTHYKEDFSR